MDHKRLRKPDQPTNFAAASDATHLCGGVPAGVTNRAGEETMSSNTPESSFSSLLSGIEAYTTGQAPGNRFCAPRLIHVARLAMQRLAFLIAA